MLDPFHYHVIKDPIHQIMQWEHDVYKKIVKPIMDSPVFQRMRYIYQLGMTDKVFPGSTHTRFSHSLGCCYVASRIFKKLFASLLASDPFAYGLMEKYVLATSLLHDIGHGPFSHAFERFFHNKFRKRGETWMDFKIDHEDWTREFLKNDMRAVVDSIFEAEGDSIENICALISHKSVEFGSLGKWMSLAGDIISSQLDADRMDYLLRDGHFCGVAYGTFDLEWMINAIHYEEMKGKYRMSITRKGVGAIEHFLAARRLMTQNIYHHLKVKAEEEIMVELLLKLHHEIFARYLDGDLYGFLKVVDDIDKSCEDREQTRNRILKEAYPFFKKISDHDIYHAVKNIIAHPLSDGIFQEVLELAEVIYYREKWPSAWKLDANRRGIEGVVERTRQELGLSFEKNWQLKVIEYPFKMLKTDRDPILVSDDYQTQLGSNIQGLSEFAKQMGGRQEKIVFLSIHHTLMEKDAVKKLHDRLLEEQFFALPPPPSMLG